MTCINSEGLYLFILSIVSVVCRGSGMRFVFIGSSLGSVLNSASSKKDCCV